MPPAIQAITFDPPLSRISSQLARSGYAAICGANNSGKSLILKHLKKTIGSTAYMAGPQRFYHIYHISTQDRQPNEFDQHETNFNNQFSDTRINHEQNYIDLGRIIANMNDKKRDSLFEVCGRLIGNDFSMKRMEEDNELSMRYIDMSGQNISVGSTGTRLLMTLIGLCMDERIATILIDEPELGLGPKIQLTLSSFFANRSEREKYFPHLNSIIVATHSHLFLDRSDIQNNFLVKKTGATVEIEQVSSFSSLHNLQFNLLGNTLESLFLPTAFVIVEGKTDALYIERCIGLRHPDRKIIVVESRGDLKQRLHTLKEALGDISKSPFRSRIFAILDSVHNKSDPSSLVAMGMITENIIIWDKNGIEYLYPADILANCFSCSPERLHELSIIGDEISLNGVFFKKSGLSELVLKRMTPTTIISTEIEVKLLEPLRKAIE